MNLIIEIAKGYGRDYITPEDVAEALQRYPNVSGVRLDLLEVLGKRTGFGVEDWSLCAFIAWKGGPTDGNEDNGKGAK